jgi:hypothetical protein
MITDARLHVKPEADTRTVEELVARTQRGSVRIPVFQRGLRWDADDVVALFDSIYRGYPIGSLLLRKGAADEECIRLGPLSIDAPRTGDALWVVDGQQRLTALAAGLLHPNPAVPIDAKDVYGVYFDVANKAFVSRPRDGVVPATWIPVSEMLDASKLIEWVYQWSYHRDPDLRSAVFDAGTRIRQYPIPLYIVSTSDDESDERVIREIFRRVNNQGHRLTWDEVHDALFGKNGDHPSTLNDLANELERLGMGRPEKQQLLTCLIASKGLDPTRNFSQHYRRDQEILREAVADGLPALRRVFDFLRVNAEIPHLRLLPRSLPLVILTRFFALHEKPGRRTLELLTRWTWRAILSLSSFDERTLLRHGVAAVERDEELSVQQLLKLVPSAPVTTFDLPPRFDARAAESRIALLGMNSMQPLTSDGSHIDVASEIQLRDVATFRRIWPRDDKAAQSPENRVLLPGQGSARNELLAQIRTGGTDSEFLASHGISPVAAARLIVGEMDEFLQERRTTIEIAVQKLGNRLAGWGLPDRPTLGYILHNAGGEP